MRKYSTKSSRLTEARRCVRLWDSVSTAFFMDISGAGMAVAAKETNKEPSGKVLRVPCTQTPGIFDIDENGNRYGMLVDYLNEIAKYTNWTL